MVLPKSSISNPHDGNCISNDCIIISVSWWYQNNQYTQSCLIIHNVCCDLYLDSECEVHWDLYVWIYQIHLICQLLNVENFIFTHTMGYAMLGLCVKPYATSSHCSPPCFWKETLWGKILLWQYFLSLNKSNLLNCHLLVWPNLSVKTLCLGLLVWIL